MTAFPLPRRWTTEELDRDRLLGIVDFRAGRNAEGSSLYETMVAQGIDRMERLFAATDDLTTLLDGAPIVADKSLVTPLRYVAGPPVSADDLATMAEVAANPRTYTRQAADEIVALLMAAHDRARFPWITQERMPTPAERWAAILATATLSAATQAATARRTSSAKRQEAAVLALLEDEGFTKVPRRLIDSPDGLARGEVCAESIAGGVKADVCVRLRNGRLLLIECKVSGSALNSVKRIIHDIGDKLAVWDRQFGAQAIPMGVISGVVSLKTLVDAQAKGIFIVWERDLSPLAEFVRASR